jgi:hypothetical protein
MVSVCPVPEAFLAIPAEMLQAGTGPMNGHSYPKYQDINLIE